MIEKTKKRKSYEKEEIKEKYRGQDKQKTENVRTWKLRKP